MRSKTPSVFIVVILLLAAGLFSYLYFYQPRAREKKLEIAAALVRSGDDRSAIPLLRELAAGQPGSPGTREAALLLAGSLDRVGEYPGAGEIWNEIGGFEEPVLREASDFHLALLAARRGDPARLDGFLVRYPASPRAGEARLVRGRLREEAGDPAGARKDYLRVLDLPGPEDVRAAAGERLGEINLSRLFSREDTPGTVFDTVRAGDSLTAIARRRRTTPELVRKMNALDGDLIHPGQALKLPAEIFSARVSKSKNTLTLLYGGEFFKEYPVGTGRDNCSPVGEFTIVTKLIDPPWIHGGEVIPPSDERNILGTRWLGFGDPYAAYGIHGTTRPETVGSQSSDGCVRMRNRDVEELFIFLPRGARVRIED